MNSKDNKTSRELKQEVIQELNQVNNDIDRIQDGLTPGRLIDNALFQATEKNPRAIFDHLKANPIGTAFLGLGTLLLMEDDSHVTYESQARNRSKSLLESSRYQTTLLKGRVSDVNRAAQLKVDGISGKIHGAIDRTKSKVQGLKGMGTTGESDLNEGGELGASSIDQLQDHFGDVKEVGETLTSQMDSMKKLDPMTFAALGAGLGALTGIALPVSDKEQMLIDQKASGKLNQLSSEFQDAINESVKVLKDEFLGKFTDFDVSLFGRKQTPVRDNGVNENPQF